ncbi:MAG: hypothetical protein OJJ54_03560 [Pseudonocardia sp.]|nr:hypothetical protein [Pseudonocardia sp.]
MAGEDAREPGKRGADVRTDPQGLPTVPRQRGEQRRTGTCTCGHPYEMHEHYRAGSDCGECGAEICPAFAPDDAE